MPDKLHNCSVALIILSVSGCVVGQGREPLEAVEAAVIYGDDDRQEPYLDSDLARSTRASESAVALVSMRYVLGQWEPEKGLAEAPTLAESRNLCPGEPFATQPTAGFCSGTLIAPDLVLTAGHCLKTQADCDATRFVFDYQMADANGLQAIPLDSVFECESLLLQEYAPDSHRFDYAIVRLNRPAAGRTVAKVAQESKPLDTNASLSVQGYPEGLPLKITAGGSVRDARSHTLDVFQANLDVFPGSSGSGVFDEATGLLVGVVARDEPVHFVQANGRECYVHARCDIDGCSGNESSYAFRAVEELCRIEPEAALCHCGDGVCSEAENAASCSLDCGEQRAPGTGEGAAEASPSALVEDEQASGCSAAGGLRPSAWLWLLAAGTLRRRR